MAGMKDKVIHFYFGVDREVVWLAVKDRIPAVKPLTEQILHDLETG
ncbi:MAG: HepT-like ribonuclease domain-containing protein [Thermodesulfobacteriota bacterium]